VLVAYSGGVDSSLLLRVAVGVLGERAVGLLAESPSVPRAEAAEAVALAERMGARLVRAESHEITDPRYRANPANRCYYCKSELFAICKKRADALGLCFVADGCNADDLGDFRPGRVAAAEMGVRSPLVEAGLSKEDVRALSRRLGLPTADKAAFACLASRFPTGTEITEERLGAVERCEDLLREAGFRQFRARFHGDVVRIELGQDEMDRMLERDMRERIVAGCRAAGFRHVALDLAGYRTGAVVSRVQ
jgi:uncharacterized protein